MRQGRFLGDVFQMLKGCMPLANFRRREYVVEVCHGGWRELPYHLGKQLAVDHSPHPLDHPVERWKAWQFVGVTAQLLHRHINEIGRLRQHPGRLSNDIDGKATCGMAVSWLQSKVGPDSSLMPPQGPRRGGERLEVSG